MGKSYRSDPGPAEGPSFTLNDLEFRCRPRVAGTVMLQLIAKVAEGSIGDKVQGILDLFEHVMPKEDYERFRAHVDDPEVGVSASLLSDIANDLITEYSDRPTEQPSGSSPGLSPTGPG